MLKGLDFDKSFPIFYIKAIISLHSNFFNKYAGYKCVLFFTADKNPGQDIADEPGEVS